MLKRIAVIFAALVLSLSITAAITPQTASAGNNWGVANNINGSDVQIDCNYTKGPYFWLTGEASKGQSNWAGYNKCKGYGNDIDRARSKNDGRCIHYAGPAVKDGWYYAKGNKWYKVFGLGKMEFWAYSSSRCSKSREYPYT